MVIVVVAIGIRFKEVVVVMVTVLIEAAVLSMPFVVLLAPCFTPLARFALLCFASPRFGAARVT